jgi:hypothetical protein
MNFFPVPNFFFRQLQLGTTMNANVNIPDTPEKYLPLSVLSGLYQISVSSLKQLFHAARKQGIPLPERRKVRRLYLYDRERFNEWLWENGEKLKSNFPMHLNDDDNDAE